MSTRESQIGRADLSDIVQISNEAMAGLSRDELVTLISAVQSRVELPINRDPDELRLLDSQTLLRMAHLARFAWKNRLRQL